MVFFVDHDRDGFVLADGDAACTLRGCVLFADEVPLDEQLPIDIRGVLQIDVQRLRRELRVEDRVANSRFELRAAADAAPG